MTLPLLQWHITDPIEETPDRHFFSSFIYHSRVRIYFFLKVNILYLLIIPSPPHQDNLCHINYCHQPSTVPIFVHFHSQPPPLYTVKQFTIRPKFSSIIVAHHPPSAEQSKFFYQILYLLFITSPPHQYTLYHINYCHLPSSLPISVHLPSPPPPLYTLKQFIIQPKFSSIIVNHHTSSAEQRTFFYQIIYLLIILSPPYQDNLYHINYYPP